MHADFTEPDETQSLSFHLLGAIDFDRLCSLQRALAGRAKLESRVFVLLCEHPKLVTIGRGGSRGHLRATDEELRRLQTPVRWVSRGGGCVLHGPGQLCVYPIAPLEELGWTVGEYLSRLVSGIRSALSELGVPVLAATPNHGIWGRTGMLAELGVAVRNHVTTHGAFINVNPSMHAFSLVQRAAVSLKGRTAPSCPAGARQAISCLFAERSTAGQMSRVRASVITHLAAAFEIPRYHLQTGPPSIASPPSPGE